MGSPVQTLVAGGSPLPPSWRTRDWDWDWGDVIFKTNTLNPQQKI